ncbi:MAG: amidohydrolase [Acetobacteraceae bacterium]
MTALPMIDAHHHFWDLDAHHHPWLTARERIPFRYGDYGAICRTYLPPNYRADTAGYPVVGTVHMEAEIAPAEAARESDWLAGLSAREGLPWACVAQARLDHPDRASLLAAQAACPMVRGIRHKPATASSAAAMSRGAPGSMDDPAWRGGYALLQQHGFSFDLQAPWWHAEQAASLAADFPGTPLIINHSFLPADRSQAGLAAWRQALERVARQPNVALKISGLGLLGRPWRAAENVPIMRDAIAILGWQRCLFASNFPVDSLVARFGEIADAFLEAIADRPLDQRRALLHDNAVRLYRLDPAIAAATGTGESHRRGETRCPSAAAASP